MAGIIVDGGISILNALLGAAMVTDGETVALFTNNHTPVVGDTFGTYTEATFGGYARQNLSSPTNAGVGSNIDKVNFAVVVFTPSGSGLPVTVYGYLIMSGSNLVGAELFPVALTISVVGQNISVLPSITYQDRSIP